MNIREKRSLEVTVDKRHIIALGERLYKESVELLRELINNAYDADATEVLVYVGTDRITVQDDGSGMDAEGLKQYFNVGSDEKISRSVSPEYKRERVGQFGIGKFASLAAATRFEVQTQKGDFAARVVFDKEEWEAAKSAWQLPCEILAPDPARGRRDDGHAVRADENIRPGRRRGKNQRRRSPESAALSLFS